MAAFLALRGGKGIVGRIRVTILADAELQRKGLQKLLEEKGFEAEEWPLHLYRKLERNRASSSSDHILLVNTPPDDQSLAIVEDLRRVFPESRIALFCESCDATKLQNLFAAGVDTVMLESTSLGALAIMLHLIAGGEKFIPSPLIAPLAAMLNSHAGRHTIARYAALTPREIDVLLCLVDGDANKQIARRLDIGEAMVKLHVKTILRKLSVLNRTQAAIWAVHNSIDRKPSPPTGLLGVVATFLTCVVGTAHFA